MPNIVVCGLGQVGYRVCILLVRLGVKVSVVTLEPREEFAQKVSDLGVRIIVGDARSDKNLLAAGIADADALIAVADNDLTNIECALDSKRLNPKIRTVLRLFDQNLARRLERSMGIDRALAMSAVAAPAFAAAAFGEEVRGAFQWSDQSFVVGDLEGSLDEIVNLAGEHTCITRELHENHVEAVCDQEAFSKIAGIAAVAVEPRWKEVLEWFNPIRGFRKLALIWSRAPGTLRGIAIGIVVLTVLSVFIFQAGMNLSLDNAIYFVISTVTTTGYGDITPLHAPLALKLYGCLVMLLGSASIATFYSIITDFIVTTRFDQLFGRQHITTSRHVIVVGLGSVGIRCVMELRKMGVNVVAIDSDANANFRSLLDRHTAFVSGDSRDPDTLTRAGIGNATALLAVTGDDAVNLSVCLSAKTSNSAVRVVARLFDAEFAGKVHGKLDIDAAMSASRIAAPSFVGAALFPQALFFYIRSEVFHVLLAHGEKLAPPPGWKRADLLRKKGTGFDVLSRHLKDV